MALGIKDMDARHIHTVELHVGQSVSTDDPKWAAIVSLNAAYCYGPPYIQVLRGYNNPARTMPVFMVEAVYEFEGNAQPNTSTPLHAAPPRVLVYSERGHGTTLRQRLHMAVQAGLEKPPRHAGSGPNGPPQGVLRVAPWYDLVPDQTHRTLTGGYGTIITDKDFAGGVDSNDYATAARTGDGSLALAVHSDATHGYRRHDPAQRAGHGPLVRSQ